MKNVKHPQFYYVFTTFFTFFAPFLRPILTEKYHKIINSSKKHDCFNTVFFESTSQLDNRTIRQSPAEDTCSLKTYNSNINY